MIHNPNKNYCKNLFGDEIMEGDLIAVTVKSYSDPDMRIGIVEKIIEERTYNNGEIGYALKMRFFFSKKEWMPGIGYTDHNVVSSYSKKIFSPEKSVPLDFSTLPFDISMAMANWIKTQPFANRWSF